MSRLPYEFSSTVQPFLIFVDILDDISEYESNLSELFMTVSQAFLSEDDYFGNSLFYVLNPLNMELMIL